MTWNGEPKSDATAATGSNDGTAPECRQKRISSASCIDNHTASSLIAQKAGPTEELPFSTVRNVFQQVLSRTLSIFKNADEEETVHGVQNEDTLYGLDRPSGVESRIKVQKRRNNDDSNDITNPISSGDSRRFLHEPHTDYAVPAPEIESPEVELSSPRKHCNTEENSLRNDVVDNVDQLADVTAASGSRTETETDTPGYDLLVIDCEPSTVDLDTSTTRCSEDSGIPRRPQRVKRRSKTQPNRKSLKSVPEDIFPTKPIRHRRKSQPVENTGTVDNRSNFGAIDRAPVGAIASGTNHSDPQLDGSIDSCHLSDVNESLCHRRKSLYDQPGIFEAFVSSLGVGIIGNDPSGPIEAKSSSDSDSDNPKPRFNRFSKTRSNFRRGSVDFERDSAELGSSCEYGRQRRNSIDVGIFSSTSATYPGRRPNNSARYKPGGLNKKEKPQKVKKSGELTAASDLKYIPKRRNTISSGNFGLQQIQEHPVDEEPRQYYKSKRRCVTHDGSVNPRDQLALRLDNSGNNTIPRSRSARSGDYSVDYCKCNSDSHNRPNSNSRNESTQPSKSIRRTCLPQARDANECLTLCKSARRDVSNSNFLSDSYPDIIDIIPDNSGIQRMPAMDENNAVVRKGPVMGTSDLVSRQQVYLQAYMERYGQRRSNEEQDNLKFTLSSQTLSRVAKSETLAKYIQKRLESSPVKDDQALNKGDLKRGFTMKTENAKPNLSRSFTETRRAERSPKISNKNMRSCTDPGFLSDSSDCALSHSEVESQPNSPARSRHSSFGSNSSFAKFFKRNQLRSRFHIPSLDDLKRKKKSSKAGKSHMELDKRRSLQFEGQMDNVSYTPVHKTLSTGGIDMQRPGLSMSNHGYGQVTEIDDHWAYRCGRSLKVSSHRLSTEYDNLTPREVHKASSYNNIRPDNGGTISRVQSDSRITMTDSLPPHWLTTDSGPAYFYDSSDTESNYDEPFRHRNRSSQSLADQSRTDRLHDRMTQSYTENSVEWDIEGDDYISQSLVNVTQDIYSCFASEESKKLVQAQSVDYDNSLSARQRRRLLKESRTCSQPDSLPRLERSKAVRTPDRLSPNHPKSLPSSRPGSQPSSRSQSPQPPSLIDAIRGAQEASPHGHHSRRRIYSSDDSTEAEVSGGQGLTRARSLPGQDATRARLGSLEADLEDRHCYDAGSASPSCTRLEVPSQYQVDPQLGSVVRSSSDVTDVLLNDDRRSRRRQQRHYKSDPFTEIGGHHISYTSLKEKLLSQSVSQYECRTEPGGLIQRKSSHEESTSSGSQVIDIVEEETDHTDLELPRTDSRRKKKKASVCDDCEASFIISRQLSEDMDHLCKSCDHKRTERRKAILEIVNTEISYGRDLNILSEEFYVPMQNNSLLTPEQVPQIFLNLPELIKVNARFSRSLEQAILHARQNRDHNFNTVHIGKFFLENSLMFLAFENYCIKHTCAIALLERLEKEKELLRIFLEVSQNENQALRRMNLKSFLMVPVQRVFKYPLLLSRLHQATPSHHKDLQNLKEAQNKIEEILNHINSSTKSNTGLAVSRIKTKGSMSRGKQTEDIEIQKTALTVVGKQHNEAVIAYMGRLQCAIPTEVVHWVSKKVKFTPVHGVLVSSAHVMVPASYEANGLIFPRSGPVTEASLVLLKEKNGKYVPFKDYSQLGKCIVSFEEVEESIIEVQEMSKESLFLKADSTSETLTWLKTLRYHSKDVGLWRRRRNALANIMMSKPSNTSTTSPCN